VNSGGSQVPSAPHGRVRVPRVQSPDTRDVRRKAVARARSSDEPPQKIATDLGITTEDLRRWLEDDARRRDATKDVVVKALVTVAAVSLLVYHLLRPHAAVDAVTVGLLAVAALPWLSRVIESADFLGAGIKFRELKATQQRQGAEIEALNFVIESLVTEPEILHLEKLASDEPFRVSASDATIGFLIAELTRLRQMGFIEGAGIRTLKREGGDVKDYLRIGRKGREYLDHLHSARPPGS
jgi:hypothetical protein